VHRISVVMAMGVVALLVWGNPAHAYVLSTGTGSRTASVTSGQLLTVTGSTAVFGSNAKTSDPPVAVSAVLSNPNNFRRWAHTVTAVFSGSSKSGCTASAYQINGSPRTVNTAVPHGNGTLTVSGISVSLVNSGCKGSTVTLAYVVT